jgi:hypothetical protein
MDIRNLKMEKYVVEYEIFPLRAIYSEIVEAVDHVSAEAVVLSDDAKETLDVRIRRVRKLIEENEPFMEVT